MPRLLYTEIAPPASIAAHVDCFWTVAVDASGPGTPHHMVFPDGCWTLSIGIRPTWYMRLRAPATTPFVAPSTADELIAGARFRPGPPPAEVLDHARRMLRPGQSVQEIFFFLSEIIQSSIFHRDHRLDFMISKLRVNEGRLAVAKVTEELDIGERQLERLSTQHLGLSPKTFARIVRLQSVLRCFISSPSGKLAGIATDFGYADQAHMARDFTQFGGGITPLQYRRSLAHVGFVLESAAGSR